MPVSRPCVSDLSGAPVPSVGATPAPLYSQVKLFSLRSRVFCERHVACHAPSWRRVLTGLVHQAHLAACLKLLLLGQFGLAALSWPQAQTRCHYHPRLIVRACKAIGA